MNVKLVVDLFTVFLGNELNLLTLKIRNLNLEFLANFTSNGVIKSVKKLSDDSESFRYNTSDFTRVISSLATFYSKLDDANSSER
jgi:hypothetical protein